MIALDTNILVELLVASVGEHQNTSQYVASLEDELCTTPTNVGEVLRLVTHLKVFSKPVGLSQAVFSLQQLFDYFRIQILDEDINWWHSLSLIEKEVSGIRGNEIFDARIALCLKEHGVKRICTKDADFRKYSFLKIIKPN